MSKNSDRNVKNIFPRWANKVPLFIVIGIGLKLSFIVFVFWYWFSPYNLNVGYMPEQPIPYSHRLHVGELGMDCRYCHNHVEESSHANIPPTETCMNCHKIIKKDSPHIVKVRESYEQDKPIEWVNVHQLPDYAYFNHSAHLKAGVSCVSCHGRVDQMEVVHQTEPLSMGWCLDCHREPEKYVRPQEFITDLDWESENQIEMGLELIKEHQINPGVSCSVCHR